MQPGELDIDLALVEGLVAGRFPEWAALPVRAVASAGTDNAMFRLGDDLVVRLPRVPYAARQVDTEQRWLPLLGPHLPLDVPVPVGRAAASPDFPLPWSVYRWLDGDDTYNAPLTDLAHAAVELGRFGAALRTPTRARAPPPSGAARSRRGRTAICRARSATSGPRAWSTRSSPPPPGRRSCGSRGGRAHPSGSTATCYRAICSAARAVSAPSSTSAASVRATRPAT